MLRILGPDVWGRLVIAQSIITWLGAVTQWGFPWTITRKVAANRADSLLLASVLANSWCAQILLALASVALLLTLSVTIPYLNQDISMYVYGCALILSGVIFPIWFLSGLERFIDVALMQFLSRVGTVLPIFIFVSSPEDAPLVIAINACCTSVASVMMLCAIRLKFDVRMIAVVSVYRELKEGVGLFFSMNLLGTCSTLIPVILGHIGGTKGVAHFALADRVRTSAQAVIGPFLQAAFPRMGFFWQQDSYKARLFLLHIFLIISAITILIGVLCWFFALPIVLLLGGEQFTESAELLRWMVPLPFLAAMTNFYGVQIMLGKGRYRSFNMILVVASVISLASVYPLVTWMGALGAVYNLLLLELVLAVGTASYVLRHQLLGASTNAS